MRMVQSDTIFDSPIPSLRAVEGQAERSELDPVGGEGPLSFLRVTRVWQDKRTESEKRKLNREKAI